MIEGRTWQVRCDWPECESVGEVAGYGIRPAGWTHIPGGIQPVTGFWLGDLCSIHGQVTLAVLAAKADERVAGQRAAVQLQIGAMSEAGQ